MEAFGYSRQELFDALPEMVRLYGPEAAEKTLARIRAEAAGKPLAELDVLTSEANFRERQGDPAAAVSLSERAVAMAGEVRAGPAMRRELRLSLLSRRLAAGATADAAAGAEIDREIAELASGGRDAALASALLLRASTRLRDAGIAIDTHGELDSRQAEAAHAGERDIELARTCPLGPLEQIGVLLGKVALCRVLGRDEAGLELSAEAVRYLRQHLPAAGLPPRQWTDRLAYLQNLYSYRSEVLSRQRPPGSRRLSSAPTRAAPSCSAMSSSGRASIPARAASATRLPTISCGPCCDSSRLPWCCSISDRCRHLPGSLTRRSPSRAAARSV